MRESLFGGFKTLWEGEAPAEPGNEDFAQSFMHIGSLVLPLRELRKD